MAKKVVLYYREDLQRNMLSSIEGNRIRESADGYVSLYSDGWKFRFPPGQWVYYMEKE